MRTVIVSTIAAFALAFSVNGYAGYKEGIEAYDREDYLSALYEFKKSQSDAKSQYWLGTMYYEGSGVELSQKEAFQWFLKSAKQGYPYSQKKIAYMYTNGTGVNRNLEEAFIWENKSAENGDIDSQFQVASCYFNGDGVKIDKKKARVLLEKTANRGHLASMAYLLEMYRDGLGGAKDTKKYFELLQSIANLPADDDGFVAKAQHNLSAVYSKGEIVPVNSEKEMYWLNEAAENGKMSSQEVLYSRYYYGSHGVEKKSEMVFKYAMMLAKQHKIAKYQFAVGHFYNQGIGVKRDTNEGYKWMIIAEDNGSLEAKSFVDYVEKSVNEAMK